MSNVDDLLRADSQRWAADLGPVSDLDAQLARALAADAPAAHVGARPADRRRGTTVWWRSRSWTRRGQVAFAFCLILLVIVAGGSVYLAVHQQSPTTSTQAVEYTGGSGADRLPNESVSDWITYADYVVVVRPTAARTADLTPEETARGEGMALRRLTMTVDSVLWSAPDAHRPAPTTFGYWALGYVYRDGKLDEPIPVAGRNEPRLEIGHTYVMAIDWEPARCSEGDDRVPGSWRGLGSDSTVPFDRGIVGNGELGDRTVTPAQYREHFPVIEGKRPFAATLAGGSAQDLVAALHAAKRERRGNYGPPPAPCR